MRNVKDDESYEAKGRISHTLGDRKYFSRDMGSLVDKSIGFYSNSYYHIFGKLK